MGCFGERLGCFRVPQGRLGDALGSSRAALWTVWGCSGKLWGAFASSEGASPVEKLKKLMCYTSEAKANLVLEACLEHVLCMLSHKRASCERVGS